MKLIALPFWLLFAPMLPLQAQHNKPVNPKKDKIEFKGYTIKLLPTVGGSYGYNVSKGTTLVIHQSYNPFTMSPTGFQKKEDAYKVAKWQINHLKGDNNFSAKNSISNSMNKVSVPTASTHNQTIINQHLSKNVASELNIGIN